MIELNFPPGMILIIGAFIIPFLEARLRYAAVLLLPLLTLACIWLIPEGQGATLNFLDYDLQPVAATDTGRLFATIFAIMTFAGGLFALKQASVVELAAAFAYAGAAIGVTFCGDLISLFIFWELMTLGSTLVIWSTGTSSAHAAGMRYLLLHLFGGVVLMVGIIAHVYETGSVAFEPLELNGLASILILAGFLINAGAPPFSAWIADAYPEASTSGTVFLSAFTTKTAVFTLLVAFPGTEILIYIGLYMVFYGIIYALLENDMRRILAYSIVNQVGFMVTAIGIGTEMALNGAAAHAFAHIIYKGLLLMSAGSVLLQTGKRNCTDLGGLFQTMPVTTINSVVGAMAISAFPFTSGFVTKSLETAAAAQEGLIWVWFLLMAASAGVFLHAGIKFPWFVFFQKDSGMRPQEPAANMRWAMWLFSFFCIAIGVYPEALYRLLPYTTDYQAYTMEHLVSQLQLLLFSGFAFFALLPLMKRTRTISLDVDWLYRRLLADVATKCLNTMWRIDAVLRGTAMRIVQGTVACVENLHGSDGLFARNFSTGTMVAFISMILAVYLFLSVW